MWYYCVDSMKKTIFSYSAKRLVWFVPIVVSANALFTSSAREAALFIIAAGTSTLLALLCTSVIKYLVRKPRSAERVFSSHDVYAFPSGHATGLASISYSTYLQGYPIFWAVILMSVIIVFARVRLKVHDYKDIIAGIFVGVIVAHYMFRAIYIFLQGL